MMYWNDKVTFSLEFFTFAKMTINLDQRSNNVKHRSS